MTDNLVLAPPEARELAHHLDEWRKWRQSADDLTADPNWDRFIEKSREKAQWQAGLATEIDRWESLHAIHLALEEQLGGVTHAGGHTRQ
ncbi:hypothetical protein [Levilactobacillus zymae]|uniref:Uncharacterized protein n=1 Tax=Levilactobacillus zymae TaxID=267363 RepID=A0A1Y6JZS2_9LACO|nr:hypothetical protein [Levilactobacillus zymae]KRL07543.1 hypothetical protein FD38_GL000060 [Levilactobacillus zymae DSM 19395]QFR62018.1 hypothetical protein LZ395_10980 [Levilactobacillus zymae]GEO71622.1 hypothetical protein LZY01_07900 [Levilactobacillus zymae]SMS15408.1 hypothetical protein LZ3411_2358 [Levilactobacillus zymae]